MTVKVRMANGSSDSVDFLNDAGTTLAQVKGYDDGSSNGHVEIYTTASGVSSEKVRVDSAGNVGVGTSSPSKKLDVQGATASGQYVSTTGTNVAFHSFSNTGGGVLVGAEGNGGSALFLGTSAYSAVFGTVGAYPVAFATNNTERMRLDSSGNLLVGTTSGGSWTTRYTASTDSGTTKWCIGPHAGSSLQFIIAATGGSGVYLPNTSATAWSAISDERHKDIIEPITNAAEKVCTLRAVIGKYKTDETNSRKSFLIAQDVLAILPEAVDTSDPERFGLAYTDTIPLLVAAIQEQQALIVNQQSQIDALTERLTALENK